MAWRLDLTEWSFLQIKNHLNVGIKFAVPRQFPKSSRGLTACGLRQLGKRAAIAKNGEKLAARAGIATGASIAGTSTAKLNATKNLRQKIARWPAAAPIRGKRISGLGWNSGRMSENPQHQSSNYCETTSGKWVKIVRAMVGSLNYGEVQLTIHKNRIVEIRKIEKLRLEQDESPADRTKRK
jgi:hypothetical protein